MKFLDLLFPKSCLGCKAPGSYVCQSCLKTTGRASQKCLVCAKPAIDGVVHEKCKRKFTINGCVSIWKYKDLVRKVLLSTKYSFAYEAITDLARVSTPKIVDCKSYFGINPIVVAVPASVNRKNWRGFNQSEIIAKVLAKQFGYRYADNIIFKKRETVPQTNLDRNHRLINLRNAFTVAKGNIKNNNFIIVDDVVTTGSTLKEIAKVLKRAGANSVWGVTLAV